MIAKVTKMKKIRHEKTFFKELRDNKSAYLLILPAVLYTVFFCYAPMFGIVIAFKDFDILKGLWGSDWVGFDNFKTILQYPAMLRAIGNSFYYGVVMLFLGFPFPIILALLFNELRGKRFKKTMQTISYLPHFLSWISVVGIFFAFFATEGTYNQIMAKIFGEGYEAKNILLDSKAFLPVLFVTNMWKSVGWSSVLYLAAIAGVDATLYEAAAVDGCGKFKQVFKITLPSIAPTIIICLIMNLSSFFRLNFEQVYGFQNVYTQEQTEIIGTLVYRQGVENGKYSIATALGLMEGALSVMLLFIANSITKKLFSISIW